MDLDGPILQELKRLQKVEGKSLGRLVSDLLAQAMAARRARRTAPPAFHWTTRAMKARIDLADKDALHEALDGDGDGTRP